MHTNTSSHILRTQIVFNSTIRQFAFGALPFVEHGSYLLHVRRASEEHNRVVVDGQAALALLVSPVARHPRDVHKNSTQRSTHLTPELTPDTRSRILRLVH